jgi:hypothetical protein
MEANIRTATIGMQTSESSFQIQFLNRFPLLVDLSDHRNTLCAFARAEADHY